MLISTEQNAEGIFPIVQIKVDGIDCRALIDSGAGSSYASAKLINLLKKKPVDVIKKRVDMLMVTSSASTNLPNDGQFNKRRLQDGCELG